MGRSALAMLAAASVVPFATVSLANGCGSSNELGDPPPLSTGGGSAAARDAAVESAAPFDASLVDAGPDARRFTGTLAATTPTDFGGAPYCKYRITLKQIDVDVTVDGAGRAVAAYAKDVAVEEAVPPCPNPPMPPKTNEYSLTASSKLPSGALHIDLVGYAPNQPNTTLFLDGAYPDLVGQLTDATVVVTRAIDANQPPVAGG